ncbi:hypothetical protein OROGR_007065 [Orobanche gracilis]
MTPPSELNFDCKPHIYSLFQKCFGDQQHVCDQETQRLEEFVACLEEERLKIDAFKRELPLCMQLLTNAMEASRQQLKLERSKQLGTRPILEEFIPLKNTISSSNTENEENNITADKANWMTSAQLWNRENEETTETAQSPPIKSIMPPHQETEIRLGLNGKHGMIDGGGALLPFSPAKDHHHHGVLPSSCDEGFPELALASSHRQEIMIMGDDKKNSPDTCSRQENSGNNNKCGKYCGSGEKEQVNTAQTHRKARRCWSPDLHRRFVNALHMLGGSQAATPKQIRELMKVDGLTNDEVKSHLQKYRLHTRRPSPSSETAATGAPQVVFLGGIWVPAEYASASPAGTALYGSHSAAATHHHANPTPFCSPAPPLTPQEIYPARAVPPSNSNYQMRHHASFHHQQVHLYSKTPLNQKNGSPESGIQGGAGDHSESIEDEKSESGGSWKADSSGENGGGGRSRPEGEESNARTVVSLKF